MLSKTMLGLKMNLEKSKLIPIERVDNVEELASWIGCKAGVLLSTYVFLWVPFLNWWWLRMGWKSSS